MSLDWGMTMSVQKIILKNREEWLHHRSKYIGGSDAACIIGLNPWKSNVQLWEEKMGLLQPEDISEKSFVQYGIAVEPIMRELFQLNHPQYKVEYEENNSWMNDKYPYAAVSHDGWMTEIDTGRKGIWECKSTEIVSSMSKEKWAGRVPDNYYCQIIHSLLVREDCEFAHLTAILTYRFRDKELYQQIKNYHFERSDLEDDISYLAKNEAIFFESLKKKKRPALILPEI